MKAKSIELIAELMSSSEVPMFAKEKLSQIMRIETMTMKVGGFKMTDVLLKPTKENHRWNPFYLGVYFDARGYEVATEGHILIWKKTEVPSNLAGKVIGQDGNEIVCHYPNWQAVIPTPEKSELVTINFDKIAEFASDWKANKKILGKVFAVVFVANRYLNLALLVKFARAMKSAEINQISVKTENDFYPVWFGSLDGMGGLLLPTYPPTKDNIDKLQIYEM
jgi:hypothetical protein